MGQMRVRRTGPWVKISCPFSWVQFKTVKGSDKGSNRKKEVRIFIDEKDEQQHYCKSAFAKENTDYMENQSMLTVLKKEKIENGETVVLYRHPNFKEE